eukprot:gene627-1058_t
MGELVRNPVMLEHPSTPRIRREQERILQDFLSDPEVTACITNTAMDVEAIWRIHILLADVRDFYFLLGNIRKLFPRTSAVGDVECFPGRREVVFLNQSRNLQVNRLGSLLYGYTPQGLLEREIVNTIEASILERAQALDGHPVAVPPSRSSPERPHSEKSPAAASDASPPQDSPPPEWYLAPESPLDPEEPLPHSLEGRQNPALLVPVPSDDPTQSRRGSQLSTSERSRPTTGAGSDMRDLSPLPSTAFNLQGSYKSHSFLVHEKDADLKSLGGISHNRMPPEASLSSTMSGALPAANFTISPKRPSLSDPEEETLSVGSPPDTDNILQMGISFVGCAPADDADDADAPYSRAARCPWQFPKDRSRQSIEGPTNDPEGSASGKSSVGASIPPWKQNDPSASMKYEHYEARVAWDTEDPSLDLSTWSGELRHMRMYFCKHGPSPRTLHPSGEPVTWGTNTADLWNSVEGSVRAATADICFMPTGAGTCDVQPMDVEDLSDWVSKLRPRSIHDFKPLLILCQSLLSDLLSSKRELHSEKYDNLKHIYEAEHEEWHTEKLKLQQEIADLKAKGGGGFKNKFQSAVKKVAVQTKKNALESKFARERLKQQQLEDEVSTFKGQTSSLRQQLLNVSKQVQEAHVAKESAENKLKELADKAKAQGGTSAQSRNRRVNVVAVANALTDPTMLGVPTNIPPPLLKAFQQKQFTFAMKNANFIKCLTDPQFLALIMSTDFLSALESPNFLGAMSHPALLAALCSSAFVRALGNENFLGALRDEQVLSALTNTYFLQALGNKDFLAALNNPMFLTSLTNDSILHALTLPAFITAMGNVNFTECMASELLLQTFCMKPVAAAIMDERFLEALKRPEVYNAMHHASFLTALSSPNFINALGSPSFLEAMGNSYFITALGYESTLQALADENTVMAFANDNFLNALANPGFLRALGQPAFLKSMENTRLLRRKLVATIRDTSGSFSRDLNQLQRYYNMLAKQGDLLCLCQTGTEEEDVTLASLVSMSRDDTTQFVQRWKNFHLKSDATTKLVTEKLSGSTKEAEAKEGTEENEMGESKSIGKRALNWELAQVMTKLRSDVLQEPPLESDTMDLVKWIATNAETVFGFPESTMKLLVPELLDEDPGAVDAVATWVILANSHLFTAEEDLLRSRMKQALLEAEQADERGEPWSDVDAQLDLAEHLGQELELEMRLGNMAYSEASEHLAQVLPSFTASTAGLNVAGDITVEMDKFLSVEFAKLTELNTWEAGQEEFIKKIVKAYFKDLRNVYKHYACGGMMSRTEFSHLAKDCAFVDKQMVAGMIDVVVTRANFSNEVSKDQQDDKLGPAEFIEALVRIGNIKYEGHKTSLTPPEQFERLLVEQIIPNANQASSDEFRVLCTQPTVKDVLRCCKEETNNVFRHYAATGIKQNQSGTKKLTLSFPDFEAMMKDSGLMGAKLGRSDLQRIVGNVQRDDETAELDFEDFQQVICILVVYFDPNPFMPYNRRLKSFAVKIFFPAFEKRNVRGLKFPYGKWNTMRKKTYVVGALHPPQPDELNEEESGGL